MIKSGRITVRMFFILLIILIVIGIVIFSVFPPSKGQIPALVDENGDRIEGSIAEKCYVDADGCRIGLITGAEKMLQDF